jgi:hypothetical protein
MLEETPFEKGLKSLPTLTDDDEIKILIKPKSLKYASPTSHDGEWIRDLQRYWKSYEEQRQP